MVDPKVETDSSQPLPRWAGESRKARNTWRTPILALLALSALAVYTLNPTSSHEVHNVDCPYQPEPLHPKIKWQMNEDEKSRSADLLSQAVVSLFFFCL
jgi:hypothetical protein